MPYNVPVQISRLGTGLLCAGLIAMGPRFMFRVVSAYLRQSRERQAAAELNTLGDYELQDIGIRRCEIAAWVRLPRKRHAAKTKLNSRR